MYREVGLSDTRLGMILLYTAVNVSLVVAAKGVHRRNSARIRRGALVCHTRLQAFTVVLP
jgi:multiple sugar transport system permease protein